MEVMLTIIKARLPPRALGCYQDTLQIRTVEHRVLKFVDRFQNLSKESSCQQGEGIIIAQSIQEKMFRGI